ncbi:MAG: general secretion pathway protein GspM [Rhodanobacter denitrificans]|uniref:General secretion pathway protein GspM n=1 Tax=Rhodanobacter denitrificans TaxID=666685 RepID=A0A2W5KHF7_9GAMM|nr:MAG: general secretion pathway protein GspM [Rhodanobacter denitrificans]
MRERARSASRSPPGSSGRPRPRVRKAKLPRGPPMALEIKAPKDGRLLALILLAIVLLLVYMLGFHWWFVAPHLQYTEQMADLREQQLRFARTIAEQPQIDLKMGEIRAYEQENQAFMPEADVNAASASLIQRLKQVVAEHAPDSNRCQVVSSQSYTSTEEELYRRVTISVRMRCDLEQLSAVLYDLESGKPYLFADQLMIYKQQSYVPPGGRAAVQPLDVRFNLSGYIRQSGRAPK